MNQLSEHNNSLKNLYASRYSEGSDLLGLQASLDGIDGVIRRLLSLDDMREAGCFFTGDQLASELVKGVGKITESSVVLDPTCGAGNLLLACSRKLPVQDRLSSTLDIWGNVLIGFDLYPHFIELTKLRLILEAISRGAKPDCSIDKAMNFFKGIKVADAMDIRDRDISEVTHCIMNPPFNLWDSPKQSFWKKGKVNAAGVIVEHIFSILPLKCSLGAVLPEVLRSGSRYSDWRVWVQTVVQGRIRIAGQFNSKTDVDVFTLIGKNYGRSKKISWYQDDSSNGRISDFYDVSVGRLVAYRDPEEGPLRPYIYPKNVPLWKTMKEFSEYRRFKGTAIKPPFVVIRRTSRPSEKYRAAAAIISGKEDVVVENHLIIIEPKSGTISDCKRLMKKLKSDETNNFLNDRIRCRHLTVGVVKDIPYVE